MVQRILIVGAGHAAAQLVEVLRRKGFGGELIVVGDEPEVPYQRPPLSKKYLSGELDLERLAIRTSGFYAEHDVVLHLGRSARAIDRSARSVQLDDGTTLAYDTLILATGSLPRPLPVPGAALAGVHTLRTREDADRLRADLVPARHAIIVGGGYIGLETAATLRHLGVEVTVLEMADRVMNRVVAEPISRFYEREHMRHGVRLALGTKLLSLEGNATGRVVAAMTDRGRVPADLVVVGIGVVPNDGLARSAGLECHDGIDIDELCRSSDPAILAIGDCCNHPSRHYGRRIRLESVDNAFEQANTAAAHLLGTPSPHDRIPWFWSDQYEHKLLIVGLAQGHDRMVLRGDPATKSFSCCYLKNGELIAIDTVNSAKDQMAARKLIPARFRPDPEKLARSDIALKDCALA